MKEASDKQVVEVIFDSTYRCNANCYYCDIPKVAQPLHRSRQEITTSDIAEMLKSRYFKDLFRFSISGGEPTLRDDLKQLIVLALNKAKCASIVTNGLLPERIEEALSGIDVSRLGLAISLDSIGAKQDEMMNVPGAFGRIKQTIEMASNFNLGWREISFTITPQGFGEMLKVDELASRYGAFVYAEFARPAYRYPYSDSQLSWIDDALRRLRRPFTQLPQESDQAIVESIRVEMDNCVRQLKYSLKLFEHTGGTKWFVLNPYGDIYPCWPYRDFCVWNPETQTLGNPRYRFGNIKEEDFDQIWESETARRIREEISSDEHIHQNWTECMNLSYFVAK
jgi:radical SAM protein with 4Fe4S-binding SPASM domain